MKTLISMKKSLIILIGVVATLSLTACPSNSPQNNVRQRGALPTGAVNPATGQYVTNLQWGAITTAGNFNSTQLAVITNGASIGGTVSGNANDGSGTGIEFMGQIDQSLGQGTVNFAVWDTQAAQTGVPLTWPMNVVQVTGTSSGATVIVQQGSSTFIFNGTFSGGLWTGQFGTYDPSSNTPNYFANFNIMSCSIFNC